MCTHLFTIGRRYRQRGFVTSSNRGLWGTRSEAPKSLGKIVTVESLASVGNGQYDRYDGCPLMHPRLEGVVKRLSGMDDVSMWERNMVGVDCIPVAARRWDLETAILANVRDVLQWRHRTVHHWTTRWSARCVWRTKECLRFLGTIQNGERIYPLSSVMVQ